MSSKVERSMNTLNATLNPAQEADGRAAQKVVAVKPACVGVRRLSDVIAHTERRIFHAGPPYRSPQDIPQPVLHSAAQAAVFEGWCTDVTEAMAAIRSGQIGMAAAQDHRLLVPLAGVLSPSMVVLEIADPALDLLPIYVVLNEGQGSAARLGRLDEGLTAHLQWLNGEFSAWLAQCFATPLDLLPLLAQARALGDDCHARSTMGSGLIATALLQRAPQASAETEKFLRESLAFALNFWMGAAALASSAAEGTPGSSLVTKAGGNGVEFGIQLAGRPGVWVCSSAPVPRGAIDAAHGARSAVGALGDSAVVDFCGLGGQSLQFAPLVLQGVSAALPADALQRPERILACAVLELQEGLCATSALRCVEAGVGPLVLIGMIDKEGQAGRIGGGVVDVPVALFERALAPQ